MKKRIVLILILLILVLQGCVTQNDNAETNELVKSKLAENAKIIIIETLMSMGICTK
jgi:PBP1b-binding outer membrane lipoprotein LpoB